MAHQLLSKDTMMSVRETPWHKLGAVLPDYPTSIADAIEKAGLGWQVRQGDLLVVDTPAQITDDGVIPPVTRPVKGWRANVRDDDGTVLGIVSEDYKVVQNEEAFRFLDALITSDLHFETAGSLMNGKRVWVLARLPEFIEVAGDETAPFVYVANSHDGSMAVTAAVTPIRIVCWNTLSWALARSEARAERTFKFRHTGDLALKFDEARKVMGMTIKYTEAFKALGDRLGTMRMTPLDFERMLDKLVVVTPEDRETMGKRALANRDAQRGLMLDIFNGRGPDGDTRGNAPGTAWTAVNAVAEYEDWCRRYTKNTDQVQRSFENGALKQRALELVLA